MKRKQLLLTLLSTMLAFTLIAGCSEQSTTEETPDTEFNLSDDFGGYKISDEAPAFGDAEVIALDDSKAAEDDPTLNPYIDSLDNLPECDVYSLELLWGKLQYDSAETEVTDWSGSLTVERGAIRALRLIRFDGGDYIIRPRDTVTTLEWVSQTIPHFDGILVFIYDPEASINPTENSVTLETAPYSRTFSISELDSISEIIDVGDNQVSINGMKLEKLECPEGYFYGNWMFRGNDRLRGHFKGRWISADGLGMGHIKGHFGVRDDGEKIFFGKWISKAGNFRGLLKGNWGHSEDAEVENTGWLAGNYYDNNYQARGELHGDWISRVKRNDSTMVDVAHRYGHGLMRGNWQQFCE